MGVFDLDPVIASIAIDFIGYERGFNQDLLTLINIVEDVVTTYPVFSQSLTRPLHELSIAHRPYLDKLQQILRAHRPTWISDFIAKFCAGDRLFTSHRSYMLNFFAVEGFVNAFSANCPPEISDKINGRLIVHLFNAPFTWHKTVCGVASDLNRSLKHDEDRSLNDLLIEFRRANTHITSSMDSIPKLEQISKLFLREPFPIAVSWRRLIHEGRALKQCRGGWSERELLLFSDIFVYAQPKGGKYIAPAHYSCLYLRAVPRTYGGASCLDVHTPRKSFVLQFATQHDRDAWTIAFQEAVANARARQRVLPYKEAPIWVPDSLASECYQCKLPLTFFRRKHHCRSCGYIFCSTCVSKKALLLHVSATRFCKVCVQCWEAMQREKQDQEGEKTLDDDWEKIELDLGSAVAQASSSDTSSESDPLPEANQ
jgi:hypothetical protein